MFNIDDKHSIEAIAAADDDESTYALAPIEQPWLCIKGL